MSRTATHHYVNLFSDTTVNIFDRISDINTQNANLSSQKRQLESNITAMQADLDEAVGELKHSEERSKKTG